MTVFGFTCYALLVAYYMGYVGRSSDGSIFSFRRKKKLADSEENDGEDEEEGGEEGDEDEDE